MPPEGHDIPPALLAIRQSVAAADYDGRLDGLMARFVALRSSIRKGELVECEIYDGVKQLDNALVQHCSRPLRWKFADALAGHINDTELFVHLVETASTGP